MIEKLKQVGLIEVKVHQMGIGRIVKHKPQKLNARNILPEKVIKGHSISHSISYSSISNTPRSSSLTTTDMEMKRFSPRLQSTRIIAGCMDQMAILVSSASNIDLEVLCHSLFCSTNANLFLRRSTKGTYHTSHAIP